MFAVCFIFLNALVVISAQLDSRIIGGGFAKEGQFPYMVSLTDPTGHHFCGGSIVSINWILTAGHCLDWTTSAQVTIKVGSNEKSKQTPYEAISIVLHPQYKKNPVSNDIAMIKSGTSIAINADTAIIPLNSANVYGGQKATVSGWGRTSMNGAQPQSLKYLNLHVMNQLVCRIIYLFPIRIPIPDEDLCTGTFINNGVCPGDSGSPLVSNGKQIGVVSRGRSPCGLFPDIYTRVKDKLSWIQSTMTL